MLSVARLPAYFCARCSFGLSGGGTLDGGGDRGVGFFARARSNCAVAAAGACTSRKRDQARRWAAVSPGCVAFNTTTMPAKYAAAFEEPVVSSPLLNRARESEITTSGLVRPSAVGPTDE